MECQQCGAPLRPQAHFCNSCGARQAFAPDTFPDTTVTAGDSSASSAESEFVTGESGASAGRTKRPPRILRAETADAPRSRETAAPVRTEVLELPESSEAPGAGQVDTTAPSDTTDVTDATGVTVRSNVGGEGEALAALPDETSSVSLDASTELGAAEQVGAPDGKPGAEDDRAADAGGTASNVPMAVASSSPAVDWTEAETAEYGTILAAGRTLSALDDPLAGAAPAMPPIGELTLGRGAHGPEAAPSSAASRRDGMPWPLPPTIIVGGRYRVEAVISTMPEAPDAENVYRVRDLQGYEHCWACGASHGASAAADTFCQDCGADMLARDFLMSERLLPDGETSAPAYERAGTTEDTDETELDARSFTQGVRAYRVTPLVTEMPLFPYGARVTAAAASDTGASRAGEVNEDSLGLMVLSVSHESRNEPFALAIVADGLGGHANGQAASRRVVQLLSDRVLRFAGLAFTGEPRAAGHESFEDVALHALREGIEAGNAALCDQNAATGADMGSTLVALLLFGATAYVANVGDSRAYVLDDDGLRRITTDHSLVEQLVAAGQIAPEERYTHPQRNQILRSIGDEPNVQVDLFQQQLRPGMRFLLCSDGLWEMVRDDETERILREAASPQQASDLLIRAANANGGEDNITAIVVEVSA